MHCFCAGVGGVGAAPVLQSRPGTLGMGNADGCSPAAMLWFIILRGSALTALEGIHGLWLNPSGSYNAWARARKAILGPGEASCLDSVLRGAFAISRGLHPVGLPVGARLLRSGHGWVCIERATGCFCRCG